MGQRSVTFLETKEKEESTQSMWHNIKFSKTLTKAHERMYHYNPGKSSAKSLIYLSGITFGKVTTIVMHCDYIAQWGLRNPPRLFTSGRKQGD